MRITTSYGTTLLDCLNSDSSSTSSTSDIFSGFGSSKLSSEARKTLEKYGLTTSGSSSSASEAYAAVQTSAENMRTHSLSLSDTSSTSLFTKAEASGSTKDVVSEIESFVEDFNTLVADMNKMGGTVNSTYLKEFASVLATNKDALSAVGITVSSSGTLSVDSEKLSSASLSDLKALFNGSSSLGDTLSMKSIYVEANAVSAQYQNTYSSSTSSYSSSGSYTNSSSALSSFLQSI